MIKTISEIVFGIKLIIKIIFYHEKCNRVLFKNILIPTKIIFKIKKTPIEIPKTILQIDIGLIFRLLSCFYQNKIIPFAKIFH